MSGQRLTQAGAILGTPGYMSPEQVHGAEADARSDQFSFCAALYEALYHQLPYAGETFKEFAAEVSAHRLRKPPPSDVPLRVEQAVLRGLAIDPDARFPDMQELIDALESGLQPDSESPATRRASRRFGLLASLFILVSAGIALFRGVNNPSEDLWRTLPVVVAFGVALVVTIVALRRTLLRRTSSRHLVYFGLVIIGYTIAGRILAHTMGMTITQYIPLEMFGIGALLTAEAQNASPRYAILAVTSFLGGIAVSIWPQARPILVNLLYPPLVMGVVYFRLRASSQAGAKPAVDGRASTIDSGRAGSDPRRSGNDSRRSGNDSKR